MNQYEVLYVITPELDEEADKVVMDKFADIITQNGGEIEKTEVWGKRRLAYPIDMGTQKAGAAQKRRNGRCDRAGADERLMRYMVTRKEA